MKLNDTGETSKEMGYVPPAPGTYIWQIVEGIKVSEKENSEGQKAVSLQIPIEIIDIVDGEAKEGEKATYFIDGINTAEMGERRLNELLIWTGVIGDFAKHFDGDVKDLINDVQFVNKLYLKLPDKRFQATHNFREWDGKKLFNITNMGVVAKGKGRATKAETTGVAADVAKADSDW